jgi:hypothetical protein
MKEKFLEIEVGDKVVVVDECSHDYTEHLLEIENIEYDKANITETNPEGMICFGKDLDQEEWGDDYITQVTESNFERFAVEREKLWVCNKCLCAIECHEGKQATLEHSVEETDIEESRCEWCHEFGFDTLYELI